MELVALETIAPEAVEWLLDHAFGADRRRRTAYRLRAGLAPIPGLSLAARDAGTLLGTIQCWPVLFAGNAGERIPLVLVGPVAVLPERQQAGVGRALMHAALAAAARAGLDDALVLIGDPEYYARFFGFSAARTAAWQLPGPVEAHRLLARGRDVPSGPGTLGPRLYAPAPRA